MPNESIPVIISERSKVYALVQAVDTKQNKIAVIVAKNGATDNDSLLQLATQFLNRTGTTITNVPITSGALPNVKKAVIEERDGRLDINEVHEKLVELQLAVDQGGLVVVGIGKGSGNDKKPYSPQQ